MGHRFDPNVTRAARRVAALGLLALLAGWLGLLLSGGAPATAGGSTAAGGRQVFLPFLANTGAATPPTIADAGLNFAVALSPDRQVAPGSLLRATITATNGGPTALTFRELILRHSANLLYERAEGERLLVIGQSGDSTTAAFRTIGPGETVAGTILFRVRDGLQDGTTITIEPEYICDDQLCTGNLAQVQVSAASGSTASVDEPQELLVAPASGGPETVFRFSSRKFTRLDTLQLWLGSPDGGVRQLPQSYRVGADGWVRFELKGSAFGVGSWNLLAHGNLSGYTAIAAFSVTADPARIENVDITKGGAVLPELPAVTADPTPAAGRPAAAPAQTSGAGGIAGRVTDADTGAGVADVLVVVLRDGQPVSSARTRASGNYLIASGLPTGSYEVLARAASAGGALPYQDATYPQPVSVTSPDLTAGITFALSRGGTIAGRVTASDTRRGLGGVGVEVRGAGGVLAGSGATGEDGGYAVEGLPEGDYSVRFVSETGDDGDVAYAGATITGVAVSPGATVFADQSLSLRPTVATIRGRVTGPGGGLPAVFVAVFDSQAELVDLTLTEADGRYATGPLANGTYRVAFLTFFADNAATRRHVSAYYQSGTTFAGAAPVVIGGPGVVANINGALALGGSIGGAVRGADGAALADVLVAAFDAGGVARAVGRSDADGAYSLPGLAAGSYRVGYFPRYAAGEEVRRYQDSFYSSKASYDAADTVALAAGQALAGIDATLSLGGALAGRVIADDGGAGLEGVVVLAFSGAGGIAGVGVSDAAGAYSIAGLAPGSYSVLFDTIFAPFEASRGYIDEYFDDRRAPPFTTVAVTSGATTTASAGLALGGRIAGRVTGDSGLGLGGVAVLIFSGDTLVSFTMSDASGAYTTPGLPAGSYILSFDPTLSADQDTQQYAAQTLSGSIAVTVGAVTQGVDVRLGR
jgi:hypothetical protein